MSVLYGVLGPLCVRGLREIQVSSSIRRRLLSVLLLDAGLDVSCEKIAEGVWAGDPPAHARNALQSHVSGLRRLLGKDEIGTVPHGYRIRVADGCLDVHVFANRFGQALAAFDDSRWRTAIDQAQRALSLVRGDPFTELAEDAFAQPEITRLEEMRQQLNELLLRAMLAVGRNEEALPELERLVGAEPYREHLWALLMVGRYRLGLQRSALRAYDDASARLGEVGLVPGRALEELTIRIANRDSELAEGPLPLW